MKIKVCGMRDPDNVSELLGLEPDFVGFIFYERSPRFMDKPLPESMLRSWPSSSKKAGVFVNESNETILEKVGEYELDIVQLHGNESPEQVAELQDKGLSVIKVFHLRDHADLGKISLYSHSDFLLFDTPSADHGG